MNLQKDMEEISISGNPVESHLLHSCLLPSFVDLLLNTGADPIQTWYFGDLLPVAKVAKLSAITSWDGNSDKHHPLCRTSVQLGAAQAVSSSSGCFKDPTVRLASASKEPVTLPSWSTDVGNEEE